MRTYTDKVIGAAEKNRRVAAAEGIPLVAYECGQGLVARPGVQHNNKGFVELLLSINRDERMGDAFKYMLDKWYEMGGKTVMIFDDDGPWSKWGSWGLKESYLDDSSVKFRSAGLLEAAEVDYARFQRKRRR